MEKMLEQLAEESRYEENQLKKILTDTLKTIDDHKNQIFEIYEHTRTELEIQRARLLELRDTIKETIDRVDDLSRQEKAGKQRLAQVSKNFNKYSEADIRRIYEEVSEIQIAYIRECDKEKALRQERDKLEIRLRYLSDTVARAEHMALSIGSVMSYLSTQVNDVVWQIESIQKDKFIGARIIKATEDERYRISREIHDGPAQDLAHAVWQISLIERFMDRDMLKAREALGELRNEIKACLVNVRQVIFDMRPMELDDIGLTAAVQRLIKHHKDKGKLNTEFIIDGKQYDLPKHVEVTIFRIVQEALNNVIAHAEVDKAKIRMHYTDAMLNVLIADEGVGFDPSAPSAEDTRTEEEALLEEGDNVQGLKMGKHFGMLGMEERAKLIGAALSVISAKGKGTKIHLRIENRMTE